MSTPLGFFVVVLAVVALYWLCIALTGWLG